MLDAIQYVPVQAALAVMGRLPRPAARRAGMGITAAFYYAHRRLVRVGQRNLALAFPEKSEVERTAILRGVYRNLGRQMAEFCHFPHLRRDQLESLMPTVGLEHYTAACERGHGVLVLTAHLGAWELSSFGHSLAGYPMKYIMRPLDNAYLDRLVRRYRGLHGNQAIGKGESARGLLQAMAANQTVGVLLDQNSAPPQGVFVPFFGHLACAAIGPAKIALRTGAAVVPGFAVWEAELGRYALYFEPALDLIRSGNEDADLVANTAQFTAVIERWIRRYPDQWLWMHRRWKTRPPGEVPLY